MLEETREITLQKEFPILSHAVSFYVKKGFTVTFNSAIKWKDLQSCDWHRIFSDKIPLDQNLELKKEK